MPFSESDLPDLLLRLVTKSASSPASAPDISQEMLRAGQVGVEPEADVFFDAINIPEALELYSAVRAVAPDQSAEIGFCCGGSGLAILKALEDQHHGMHHVCDPYQSTYAKNAGRRNVQKAGLAHRLDFQERFPEEVFPTLPPLQFVFIDASHLFDISILDFVLADKRMDVGGVVAFHDLWMPSLQKLVRYILANRNYEIYRSVDPSGHSRLSLRRGLAGGIAAILKRLPGANAVLTPEVLEPWSRFAFGNMAFLRKTAADTRDWRHHEPF
jgi:predicted O-methyltransferase YrrM